MDRFLRFTAVGCINIVLKLASIAALYDWAGLHYLLATALAVELVIVHGFMWQQFWTFRERRLATSPAAVLGRLLRYNASFSLMALTTNLGLMRLLVGSLGVHYLVAASLTTVCAGLINFVICDRVLFAPVPERTTVSS